MITAEELQQYALFKSMKLTELTLLATTLQTRRFGEGDILFEKDEPGDSLYIVRRGRLQIFIRDSSGNHIVFRHYGAGQMVGEFSLLDGNPRSASALAVSETETLTLTRDAFLALLKERPRIGVEMMRSLAERIRYTTQYLEKLLGAIQLLSNNEYEAALREMSVDSSQDEVQQMITAFIEMARTVQGRERIYQQMSAPPQTDVDVGQS